MPCSNAPGCAVCGGSAPIVPVPIECPRKDGGCGGGGGTGGGLGLRVAYHKQTIDRPMAIPPPPVPFRPVAVSLRGPGQSPVLPFACCVGSLRSVGRCGRCSFCGVVSASAGPSSWRTGGYAGGCGGSFEALCCPSPHRVQVGHHTPRRGSVCVRPHRSTPPPMVTPPPWPTLTPTPNHRSRAMGCRGGPRPNLCLATGGAGGGSFWGCLRTGQATHPPKLTHPPTHPDPPPTPPVGGGVPQSGGGVSSACIICPLHTENFAKVSGT